MNQKITLVELAKGFANGQYTEQEVKELYPKIKISQAMVAEEFLNDLPMDAPEPDNSWDSVSLMLHSGDITFEQWNRFSELTSRNK